MPAQSTWTNLARLLNIAHPLIAAPMAGGPSTPALVAAVSNAGGLGSLGSAYSTAEQIAEQVAQVRKLTDRPFQVNLFCGGRATQAADLSRPLAVLARWHERLGLPPPSAPALKPDPFDEQLQALIDARVPVFSYTFGVPDARTLERLKSRGVVTLGTATTPAEARLIEAAGTDVVVVQGSEAGAHRGTFAAPFEESLIGTMALVPLVADAVKLPVVASGGIMDGRGLAAARCLGASGAQLGTAFLRCPESGASAAYKAAVRDAARPSALTRAFSGRMARGLVNEFMREMEAGGAPLPPFPLLNDATGPLRRAAAAQGEPEALSLWAGQAAALSRELPAGELVQTLINEMEQALRF